MPPPIFTLLPFSAGVIIPTAQSRSRFRRSGAPVLSSITPDFGLLRRRHSSRLQRLYCQPIAVITHPRQLPHRKIFREDVVIEVTSGLRPRLTIFQHHLHPPRAGSYILSNYYIILYILNLPLKNRPDKTRR